MDNGLTDFLIASLGSQAQAWPSADSSTPVNKIDSTCLMRGVRVSI